MTGYAGRITTAPSRPGGAPRKLLDVARVRAIGREASIPLKEGIAAIYRWYLANHHNEGQA